MSSFEKDASESIDSISFETLTTPNNLIEYIYEDAQNTLIPTTVNNESFENKNEIEETTNPATIEANFEILQDVLEGTTTANMLHIEKEDEDKCKQIHNTTFSSTSGNENSTADEFTTSNTSITTKNVSTNEHESTSSCNVEQTLTTLPCESNSTIDGDDKNLSESAIAASAHTHLMHTSSEPTFGVQLRNRQQLQSTKEISEGACSARVSDIWNTNETAAGTVATTHLPPAGIGAIKSGTFSASASPNFYRKTSEILSIMPRRVSFPKSDSELVTGYLEPANPWEHACLVKSIAEIANLYVISCQKHNTKPLQQILDHLKCVELNKQLRQPLLSLKSIKLKPGDCEALEEIFKRVQYKTVDLSSCDLEECAASALFQMLEYYEATNELDISSNPNGMTQRGWTSCIYMVGHSHALQVLNAQGNPISKNGAENLGSALNISNLHTLKLEHCGLKGLPLMSLCVKLRCNRILKELWLAYNDLDCKDAEQIGEMLKLNHNLELLDVSNNNIKDEGVLYIVTALIMQSREIEKRSILQRSAAIDDDDCLSAEELTPVEELKRKLNATNSKRNEETSKSSEDIVFEKIKEEVLEKKEEESEQSQTCSKAVSVKQESATNLSIEAENDFDDDTEDTVKTTKVTTGAVKNSSTAGQSMLDKLLSMNSDSSSEDGVSNLSTDTLAPCSEDTSITSDDIFDTASAGTVLTTSVTLINTNSNTSEETSKNISPSTCDLSSTQSTTAIITEISSSPTTAGRTETTHNDNSLSDITSFTPEAKTGVTSNNMSNCNNTAHNNNNNNNNNNGNNTNNNNNVNSNSILHNNTQISSHTAMPANQSVSSDKSSTLPSNEIFEVTADERNCHISGSVHNTRAGSEERTSLLLQHASSKAVDVNKNTKLSEDCDDTHSTDSAFESASEGDISRNLPEEFSRLSSSLESTRLDDIGKEMMNIETATIATESTEYLVEAISLTNLAPTPPAQTFANPTKLTADKTDVVVSTTAENRLEHDTVEISVCRATLAKSSEAASVPSTISASSLPKVTIVESCYPSSKHKDIANAQNPTPPPPALSPGGISVGLRRTDTTCSFITPATRNRSQSTDSINSDTSLDGSSSELNFSLSSQINEKLTKNDTLTRQPRNTEVPAEPSAKTPHGLKALALWNNNLTKQCGNYISDLLEETISLELLNIGKNCLANEFVTCIKESLMKNTTLTTFGLQSAHLSAKGIETLASILTFGGNSTLQRIDIRDNKLEVESLTTIAEVLKSNTTVTQIDIDDEPKRLSVGSDAHLDYARVLENVRSMCSRNEKTLAQAQAEKTANANSACGGLGRRRGGYYVGSRKISLTCLSRPLIEPTANVTTVGPTPACKLEVKRKSGARLRSPVPSPPTISPSSSPNRSRFQVFRVHEVSPLTSPLAQIPPSHSASTTSVYIPTSAAISYSQQHKLLSTSLPSTTISPLLATITSSTESIKRLSVSPRSRFHVCRIYEDTKVPLVNRVMPPITPPLNLPPTPMSKSTPKEEKSSFEADVTVDTLPRVTNTLKNYNVKEESTNETKSQITNLSPLSAFSSSSSSPSTSSSSSTSPASVGSNTSSSSATSSSPTPSPNNSNSDCTDSSDVYIDEVPTLKRCPIATFGDNDITLTKNSVNDALSDVQDAGILKVENRLNTAAGGDAGTEHQPRLRKVSWIANQGAVDKLLTLFHNPATIFQRSASPETKLTGTATTVTGSAPDTQIPTQQSQQTSLVPTRKNSPPSWTKLGTDILNATAETQTSVVTNAATVTLEQSRSFLDAASKPFRDLGLQVFRQNLSLANESNSSINSHITEDVFGVASGSFTNSTIAENNSGNSVGNINSTSLSSAEHNVTLLPTEVKREIKENISPEHTITDETLKSLQKQKLCTNLNDTTEPETDLVNLESVKVSIVQCVDKLYSSEEQIPKDMLSDITAANIATSSVSNNSNVSTVQDEAT